MTSTDHGCVARGLVDILSSSKRSASTAAIFLIQRLLRSWSPLLLLSRVEPVSCGRAARLVVFTQLVPHEQVTDDQIHFGVKSPSEYLWKTLKILFRVFDDYSDSWFVYIYSCSVNIEMSKSRRQNSSLAKQKASFNKVMTSHATKVIIFG